MALLREFAAFCEDPNSVIYVVAGSPCQDLTVAGFSRGILGVTGSRSVMFHYVWAVIKALECILSNTVSLQPIVESASSMRLEFKQYIQFCLGLPDEAVLVAL